MRSRGRGATRDPEEDVIAVLDAPRRSAPPRPGGHRLLLAAAVAAAAAPFAVAAVRFLAGAAAVSLAGDEALTGLAVRRAAALGQLLGPYSQWGWHHPGPAWFYLLVPVSELGGGSEPALVAAQLVLHGVLAGLVVLAASSRTAVWRAPLAAACVLVFVARMPAEVWLKVWNPYVLLLAVALLVLLTARTVADPGPSWLRWPATALAASFVVQTHVGTAVLALACVAVATVATVRSPRPLRRPRWLLGAFGPLLLVWLPPLAQQVAPARGEEGNLGLLLGYFLGGSGEHRHEPVGDRLALAGRMLVTFPAGRGLGPIEPAVDLGRADTLLALLLPLPVALLVAWAGRRLADRYLGALGVVLAVATTAALVSALLLTGPLLNYVLVWLTVLPALLLFGVLAAVAALVARRARPVSRGPRGAMAVCGVAVLVALTLPGAAALERGQRDRPDSPAVATASGRVLERLARTRDCATGPVLVGIRTRGLWPVASGLVLRLERAGYTVHVSGGWPLLFGAQDRATGEEVCTVTVAAPGARSGTPVVVVDSEWGRVSVGVQAR